DVGKLEELAPGMAPAQRGDDPPRLALGLIEAVVAAVGVGLEKATPMTEMAPRVFGCSVARGVEQRRWRPPSAERAVVADIDPDAADVRLAFGQDRNRGVVAMQALGGQNVSFDQRVQRGQRRRTRADMISQRREAEDDSFARVALALPVQRLMLPKLLEQDHRQQARPGQPSRNRMERRGRLRDRLAGSAREALAHRLDHFPLPRDDLQRLGYVPRVKPGGKLSPSFDSLCVPQQGHAAGAAFANRCPRADSQVAPSISSQSRLRSRAREIVLALIVWRTDKAPGHPTTGT